QAGQPLQRDRVVPGEVAQVRSWRHQQGVQPSGRHPGPRGGQAVRQGRGQLRVVGHPVTVVAVRVHAGRPTPRPHTGPHPSCLLGQGPSRGRRLSGTERRSGGGGAVKPDVLYARNGDVSLAYQVVGSGARDLLLVSGYVSNLEYAWDYPSLSRFLTEL